MSLINAETRAEQHVAATGALFHTRDMFRTIKHSRFTIEARLTSSNLMKLPYMLLHLPVMSF